MREDSYAEKIAGEAREFRHDASPLQKEVNTVLRATTIAMVPIGDHRPARLQPPRQGLPRRRPGGDGRAGDADPGGPRPADERHPRRRRGAARAPEHARPADGGDRGARRRRHDLRRQDRHAHRRLAEADQGRGRRPGRARPTPSARSATFAASAGERNRTLETIAAAFPGTCRATELRGPVLLAVEVERPDAERLQLRDRRARHPQARGRPRAARGPRANPRRAHLRRAVASSPSARRGAVSPATRRPSRRRDSSRARWWCSRRRCVPTRPRRSPTCAARRSTSS